MPYTHIHLFYTLLAVVFACFLAFMFVYNARSKAKEKALQGGRPLASKEAGIAEAQRAMKQEDGEHKR